MRRAFVVVLDACGVGALPDAADYGDAGTNTLGHLAEHLGGLHLPALTGLGLGSILPLAVSSRPPLRSCTAGCIPLGPGKDSTAGHRELMGLVASRRPPTYPDGFPAEVLDIVRAASGRGVLLNRPDNGIDAIENFGEQQLQCGSLIVYTSQDSVLQIAAHVDLVSPQQLYSICEQVRRNLPEEHAVGRVIARPFAGSGGSLQSHRRTSRLLPAPAVAQLSGGAPGPRGAGARRRQGGAAVRGRRDRRRAFRAHQRQRPGPDHRS